ncbi:MAG: RNA polymerase sigma factor [Planctomycetes bacterium]|nr:RNA polymerase sigma factor [Planctomycetota bacterium]MBL7039820.1 RNA polymerase sigma factor [Pirellulaceae bacterium]
MSSRAERLRDEILILEYRSGDKRALERLVSRWQPRVYRYILVMLQEENAAWDVSQDVWLAAVTGLAKARPIQNFPAWICRVAHNKAISYLRKKGQLNQREAALPHVDEQPDNPGRDPVCKAEDAGLVHECLRRIPVAQRSALILFYMEDLSLEEISQVLDVPRGTVQSRLHHGRQKMKILLSEKGYCHER